MITLLGGGIGASRFSRALAQVVPPEQITCIVNCADDLWHYGLRICPDLDTTLYAHSGRKDEQRGWGLRGDSFRAMEQIRSLGEAPWFNLGDLDLATHLLRSGWLREGLGLAEVTCRLALAMGVRLNVLPMSEDEVATEVRTAHGWMHYQRFLVQRDARDSVEALRYVGSAAARPAPGVLEAIRQAELVIVEPSNPCASVEPILALPGVRQALIETAAPVLAVTPVVAGIPIHDAGEAKRARSRAALLAAHGLPHSASGVARLYQGLVDLFVLDEVDQHEADTIASLGMAVLLSPTLLHRVPNAASVIQHILRECDFGTRVAARSA
jgi:LPPG:FO 2-phospho-L-lactate transferase